jgi:hypothetical protein
MVRGGAVKHHDATPDGARRAYKAACLAQPAPAPAATALSSAPGNDASNAKSFVIALSQSLNNVRVAISPS